MPQLRLLKKRMVVATLACPFAVAGDKTASNATQAEVEVPHIIATGIQSDADTRLENFRPARTLAIRKFGVVQIICAVPNGVKRAANGAGSGCRFFDFIKSDNEPSLVLTAGGANTVREMRRDIAIRATESRKVHVNIGVVVAIAATFFRS